MKSNVVDETDINILSKLMHDAKITYAEIGKQLFISAGTVHVRIKKMIEAGIILNTQMQVNYTKLGYDITAFLGIYLEKSNLYEEVSKQIGMIPEVVEAHYTTGTYSIFAKVMATSTDHLRTIISDNIQKIEGIQRTETFISLHKSMERPLTLVSP